MRRARAVMVVKGEDMLVLVDASYMGLHRAGYGRRHCCGRRPSFAPRSAFRGWSARRFSSRPRCHRGVSAPLRHPRGKSRHRRQSTSSMIEQIGTLRRPSAEGSSPDTFDYRLDPPPSPSFGRSWRVAAGEEACGIGGSGGSAPRRDWITCQQSRSSVGGPVQRSCSAPHRDVGWRASRALACAPIRYVPK